MSKFKVSRHMLLGLLLVVFAISLSAQEAKRAVKSQARPKFPELAQKMNVNGAVRVEVVVAPGGAVKTAKALGGHPLLIDAAVSAAKQFKFEPAPSETTETLVFNFNSGQ